ncbi:MAG: diphosphate--fructose-6-phosphate 1-phosphotransferase [Bryobacteraceae bacterium]
MQRFNLMVVQGGGPTQVLNATLAAVIEEALATGSFERVLGARGGTKGLAEGDIADLTRLPASELAALRTSPGAALGSSRFKPSAEDMERIVQQLQSMRVGHVLFIGGNGTMRGAELLLQYCRKTGYEVQILGLPKTVDNDIAGTDRCPGYASAARYVAQSTRDLGMDLRALPQPMTILETMGRSVGWLAAASALGKRDEADAPHLVYLPEAPFEMESFIPAVEDAIATHGWSVVVVSEGIRYADGRMVYQKLDPAQADPLNRPLTGGVGQYLADEVAAHLGIRCRCEKPGLLGRSSALHASCQDRKDAEVVGRAGVRGLLENRTSQMVSLLPLQGAGEARYTFAGLDEAAGIERQIPAEWVGEGAIPLKPEFFEYLRPLAGELIPYHAPISSELDFHGDA